MKRNLKRFLSLVLSLSLVFVLFAACGDTAETPATDANTELTGTVRIYTSIYPNIIEDVVAPQLKSHFPNLEVIFEQGGTDKIVQKINAELESGTVLADIVMVADPSYTIALAEDGLLHSFKPDSIENLENYDPGGFWYPVRQSNMVIAYNHEKFTEEDVPHSFEEMLDAKFNGLLGMPNPLLSGSALSAVAALTQKYGWEYVEGLAANNVTVDDGNSAVQNKILTGEYNAGMILEENILTLIEAGEPLTVIYPTDGTIAIPSPIGILSGSQNIEAAEVVANWWLSDAGQAAIMMGSMHSVRTDATDAPKHAKATSEINANAMLVDWIKLSTESEDVKKQFETIMGL